METSSIKNWITAFRLRTLPLSVSGILLGSMLAYDTGKFDSLVFILALSTVIFLQVLSNLANDLGDGIKGTDNENRVGPQRAVQSGAISVKAMKKAVILFSLLSLASGLPLAWLGTRGMPPSLFWIFIVLALLCVLAAITYTVGKKAYGYLGLGDLFVFLFFGLLSVGGIFVLLTKQWDNLVLLPASAIGLLSAAVLNLNNMRDIENDRASGKNTLVVKIGGNVAKKYHAFLIITPVLLLLLFSYLTTTPGYLFGLLVYIILFPHLRTVMKNQQPRELDPELKKVALSTFFFSLLISIWILI